MKPEFPILGGRGGESRAGDAATPGPARPGIGSDVLAGQNCMKPELPEPEGRGRESRA